MTDKTHLDELHDQTTADLGKKLVAEFIKLVRDRRGGDEQLSGQTTRSVG